LLVEMVFAQVGGLETTNLIVTISLVALLLLASRIGNILDKFGRIAATTIGLVVGVLGHWSWLVILMSVCIIGVHGMLSGTASMDFGGKKNVGVAVGIIDGFVYAGTATMSIVYGVILPDDTLKDVAGNPDNWVWWPGSMIPVSLIGLFLATRIWHAKPKTKPKQSA